MKKIAFVVLLTVLFFSCSQKNIYKSIRQDNLVAIDGNLSEWGPLRYCDKNTKICYSVYNNDTALFIILNTNDELTKKQILVAGINFCIDTLGKKSDHVCIQFLFSEDNKRSHSQSIETDNNRKSFSIQNKHDFDNMLIRLSGFKNYPDGVLQQKNDKGINAGMDIENNGVFNFELVIPLRAFYKNKISMDDTTKIFSASVAIKGFSMQGPHQGEKPPEFSSAMDMTKKSDSGREKRPSQGMSPIENNDYSMSQSKEFRFCFQLNKK